jgi:D-3-phosphoglycerate dehydrogenase
MGFRIFITGSGIAKEAQSILSEHNCDFRVGDPKDTQEDLVRKLREFNPDGLIVRQGKIVAEVQEAAQTLRVICKHGVGMDNIDVEAATNRGIPVFYTPRANFESAAEHTVGLILSLCRRITVQDRCIRSGVFDKKSYDGLELFGKTLGLVGFGRIGRRVSELISAFKMKVIVFDPSHIIVNEPQRILKVQKIEDLFRQADIISLHCPLTPETRNLINRQTIAQMKKDVYIINTARGEIVSESDLIQGLQDKRIAGAALDVFEAEPLPAEHPFLKMDNVILTPHVAGMSDNSYKNMGVESVKNVLAVLNGESVDMDALVNKEVLTK